MNKMSSPKIHDPLFHFETHFPERLSRLHLTSEFCPSSPPKTGRRSRAQRKCNRYKTQPITFDEIKEVDEENVPEDNAEDNIKQLQEFSRSMDELVVKVGSKNTRRRAKCDLSIPEDRNNNRRQDTAHGRLHTSSHSDTFKENKENQPKVNDNGEPMGLPPTGLSGSRDTRRQRMTAKAKRRQQMEESKKESET